MGISQDRSEAVRTALDEGLGFRIGVCMRTGTVVEGVSFMCERLIKFDGEC